MKKVNLATCIILLTAIYINVIGQEFSIKADAQPVSIEEGTDGKIEVIIEQGEPEYIYFLYDKEPWQGGNLVIKSDPTLNNVFVFENLPAGRYFAGAIDNSGKSTFKKVFIYDPDK